MFKTVLTALAIAVSAVAHARSKAATEAWVMNYVSNQVATVAATMTETHTNGITTISASENGTNLVVTVEDPTVRALILQDCTAALTTNGITNGIIFAYTDAGVYRNGGHTIQATATNLVLNTTYESAEVDGHCYFFDDAKNRIASVFWTLIQPSYAAKLTEQ